VLVAALAALFSGVRPSRLALDLRTLGVFTTAIHLDAKLLVLRGRQLV